MLACDQCGNWYHGHCVRITKDKVDMMNKQGTPYVCPKCKVPGIKHLPVDAKWYPNGPSFSFFPYPVIDKKRSYGSACDECGDNCYGHYVTNADELQLMYSLWKCHTFRTPKLHS